LHFAVRNKAGLEVVVALLEAPVAARHPEAAMVADTVWWWEASNVCAWEGARECMRHWHTHKSTHKPPDVCL